jgi:hypothetical protein
LVWDRPIYLLHNLFGAEGLAGMLLDGFCARTKVETKAEVSFVFSKPNLQQDSTDQNQLHLDFYAIIGIVN